MTQRLTGKVALITGSSSGIGAATARALGGEGAAVAIGARRTDRVRELADELRVSGAAVLALELDVTDEAACSRAVNDTVAEFGRLDILVNNAGVMLLGRVTGADTTDWTRMVNTNVLGLMFMTHAALPHLLEARGDLVQISSVAGRVARGGSAVYNASKFAVGAFSEALRQEVTEKGLRVVLIEPGVVATELREHITDQRAKAAVAERSEAMRQLQAEDIADAVIYAVTRPAHQSLNEITVRPTDQAW